jgi:L-ascorbate metabolism protein UlaG (beta-lactamase superfamily)
VENSKLYLKPNVKAEPLFNQWYAWTYLIAPASAAMNIANLHLKIMKSYATAPQVHANAVKNPAMLGGPFIDYDGKRVSEIRALIDLTSREQAHMIQFAQSVGVLDEFLRNEAKGHSLEPLYEKIPRNLKGFVELVYDLNNNASIRFMEGLLYKTHYYNPASQSLSLSLIDKDDRAFALSTPRLPDDNCLHLRLPFSSEVVDYLFGMKHTSRPVGELQERLQLSSHDYELFSTFLTANEPPPARRYEGEGVRVRYYGHATVLLETKDVSVLLDPVISYKYDNGIERFTYHDLPETIDYVLYTHGHQDHIMLETILQLRHKVKNIILPRSRGGTLEDPSLKLIFQHIGFKQVHELEEMETVEIEGGRITGIPFLGEHADCNVTSKIAHLISLKGNSYLFAADSNNIEPELYVRLAQIVGPIDVLFLGMECDGAPMSWLYGPLMTKPLDRKMDQSRRFSGSNYERGIGIVDNFKFKEVYVYAMGQEPWLTYVSSIKYTDESNPIVASNRLVDECRRRGIVSERLFGKKEFHYAA